MGTAGQDSLHIHIQTVGVGEQLHQAAGGQQPHQLGAASFQTHKARIYGLDAPFAAPALHPFFDPAAFAPAAQHSIGKTGPILGMAEQAVVQLVEINSADRRSPLKQGGEAVEHLLFKQLIKAHQTGVQSLPSPRH